METHLPSIPEIRKVVHDYRILGLSLRQHPLSFLRDQLNSRQVCRARDLSDSVLCPKGQRVIVAGMVLVRQRPSTASGIIFMTLEDETGIANLIVRPRVYERYRVAGRHGVVIQARGTVERQGQVVHVMVHGLTDLTEDFAGLVVASRDFH